MNDRRKLLKALSVAGVTGAVWKKPVVDTVMLPVHASATGCDLPADCYQIYQPNAYVNWPGGAGPIPGPVPVFMDGCSESDGNFQNLVVARTLTEAQDALDAALINYDFVEATEIQPSELSDGCTIYQAILFA